MNAVSIVGLITVILAAIAWFIDGMFFGGFCIGLMFTSVISVIFHRRELRRIQEDPSYLDYLLGED